MIGTSRNFLGRGSIEDRTRTEVLATETRRQNENTVGNRVLRLFRTPTAPIATLEQIIDVDRQIEQFRQNRLDLIAPQILYQHNSSLSQTRLFMHYR
ncbi:hypothetical protein, partial [Vibrio europaeus]|uniref:hypothetical protein n=1 Tax=Vibrio europaeus TaxID=300876 RepID=UPI00233E9B8D